MKIPRPLIAACALAAASMSANLYAQEGTAKSQEEAENEEEEPHILLAHHRLYPETIIVVASGRNDRIDNIGQAVTAIGEREIARLQTVDIAGLIERAPGVTLSRNGPQGGFTGVRVRGAEAEQLVVLIDGVRVADSASPGGGYDFANLTTGGIQKVSLLRGANSLVWGSDAVGGVLAVQTRRGSGFGGSAEYGSFNSRRIGAYGGQKFGPVSLAASGGWTKSDGFSSFAGGNEADGYEQFFGQGSINVAASDRLSFTAGGRYADSRAEIDGFPAPLFAFADTAEYQDTVQWSAHAGAEYDGEYFSARGSYSISETARDNFNPAFGSAASFSATGRSERAAIAGDAGLTDDLKIIFGADRERSRYSTALFGSSGETGIDSAHALLSYGSSYFDRDLTLAAGVRIDDHKQFGTHWTFGANGSVRLFGDWKLRASYGEGFKAPSLFQLLSNFGNPSLQPETSRSFDIGLATADPNLVRRFTAAITLFQRDTKNQIEFISCFGVTSPICNNRPFGTYDNAARTRARGVEIELGAQIGERLLTRAAYGYIDTENRSAASANLGNDLARRPKHALSLSMDWFSVNQADRGNVTKGLNLGADLRLVGDSFDNAANTRALDGYVLVTLRAALPIADAFEIYGRIENLLNADYQTVANFGTAGRSAFVGVRASF
ncbi:MAG: TonB-dependent receptor [Sphingorhabdus sp.]